MALPTKKSEWVLILYQCGHSIEHIAEVLEMDAQRVRAIIRGEG